MNMKNLISCLECNPVIAAVTDEKWQQALESPAQVIFYLSANLLSMEEKVRQAHEAGKYVMVHLDLAEGIGRDRSGIRFLAQCGTGGNCQGDDRQVSCSSAGNCQADEQTVIAQLSR